MNFSQKSTLSLLSVFAACACGADTLRFSGNGSSDDEATGGTGGVVNGDKGTGGFGFEPIEPIEPIGGAGGAGTVFPESEILLHAESRITDVKATEDGVYYTEYGTFDEVDNYQGDGQLIFLPWGASEGMVLADNLPAPTLFELTDDEVYLTVSRSRLNNAMETDELWRYDLESSDVEYVMDGTGTFASFGPDAVFARMIPKQRFDLLLLDDAQPPGLLYPSITINASPYVAMDAQNAYVLGPAVLRVPLDGSEASSFEDQPEGSLVGLAVNDGQLFVSEGGSSYSYLTTTSTTGDQPWTRITKTEFSMHPAPVLFGDRYFALIWNAGDVLVAGTISGSKTHTPLASYSDSQRYNGDSLRYRWSALADFVVYSDGATLYRVDVPE